MKRRLLFAMAALVILTGCSTDTTAPTQQATPGQPTTVDRIRLSGNNWGYPSPFSYSRGPGASHMLLMFDTLLWKDSTGKMLPWLASRWEQSADGKQWRFTLRDDLAVSSGEGLNENVPLFAEDELLKPLERWFFGRVEDGRRVADPGVVSQADYDAWRANFGKTAGGGSGAGVAAVPEPGTFAFTTLGLAILAAFRRRK